jgi:Matrixin
MKKTLSIVILALVVSTVRCKKEEAVPPLLACDRNLFDVCPGTGNGDYCTFGFKWGKNNPFPNPGLEKPGPSAGKIQVSYKFQDAGFVFNTHSERNLTSNSFDRLPSCAKQKIREAFAAWEAVADISFVEKASTELTDIKIITAAIQQGGIGYPAFVEAPCTDLAGMVVLRSSLNYTCESIYALSVHEIGHALGLGHVKSNNVMNPDRSYQALQFGDIKGIQSVYGKK